MSETKLAPLRIEHVLLAGLAGEIFFELYAWLFSAPLFGAALQPANLVMALANIYLGLSLPYWVAFAGHFVIGAVLFPLVVLAVHSTTRAGLILSGLGAGVLLWFFAQGVLAPVVGRDFMMGFGPYTQSSFIGHVGMTLVMALTFLVLRRGNAASTTS